MNIIIDLELNQVIDAWGSRQPAQPIQVKSQDTPTLAIYFARGAINYDMGASPGLRFGLYVSGNPNPLVQQTSFTRAKDAQSRIAYVAYPSFNTTAMLSAIGSQPSISAIGEVRYQTSAGTIARTLDVPFTVLRSLLQETILDTTIAAFTTPAVGSNVTVRINNTAWLSANLNISIGAGAGAYKVVSITNATDFVAQNSGGANNAASGTNIPSGTSVGLAPAQILNAYPDPSIIEVTTHKGAANGYAGLNASSKLLSAALPVDAQTVIVDTNGNLAAGSILAYTSANFTTPAANAAVAVTFVSTSKLVVGQYTRIPIAGYYQVTVVTDSTHATLENMGDPLNVASGTTIASGAALLPAQAVSGGGAGTAGQNAYTQTTASFVVPAVGSTVAVTVGATAWMGGNGYWVFINGAGYYAVNSITDATHAVLTNGGGASNATIGATVPSGATVSAAGPQGATGASGQGLAAYDALSAGFTMPNAGANVTISIGSTAWVGIGQVLYVQSAGYLSVIAISSATQLNVQNLNYIGNAGSGTAIASGSHVGPGGLQGSQGAGGAGLNAYTTLTANYTQPLPGNNVNITVGTSAWAAVGSVVYVHTGGWYSVSAVPDLTHLTLTNLGYVGNAVNGSTITAGSNAIVQPSGQMGPNGVNAFGQTQASFTQPPVGSSVTVNVDNSAWMQANQYIFISGGGTYLALTFPDSTHVVLQSVAATGNVASGSTVPVGSGVSPCGPPGPQGAIGATGPSGGISDAPSDGNTYGRKNAAWVTVSGGAGGPFDPRTGFYILEDFITALTASTPPYLYASSFQGSGAAYWGLQNNLYNSTNKCHGYVELQTGTAAPSGIYLSYGPSTASGNGIMLGPGQLDLASRIDYEGASLPPTAIGLVFRFGLATYPSLGSFPSGNPYNSVFLEYSPDQNSGNLRIGYNSASGSVTYVNTAGAITAGAFAWWELKIDASGNVTAYLNGTSIGTASAAAPLNAPLCPFWYHNRTTGAINYFAAVDTLYAYMPYTR